MDKINTVQEIFAVFVSHTNIEKTVYLLFPLKNLLQRNFNIWKPKYDGHKSNYKKKKWYIKGVDKSKITMDNYNTDVRVDKLNYFWILIRTWG